MNKRNEVMERFKNMGIHVKILRTKEEMENNNWIMPTNDRKGMIKINIPWHKIFKK